MTLLGWTVLVALSGTLSVLTALVAKRYKIVIIVVLALSSIICGCINSVHKCTDNYITTTVSSDDVEALKSCIWGSNCFKGSKQSKKAKKNEDSPTIVTGLNGFYTVTEDEQSSDNVEIAFNKVSFAQYLNFVLTADSSILTGTNKE